MFDSPPEEVKLVPAPSCPYECTIHTLRMHDEEGSPYNVLLDLIRSGPNPSWNIHSDSLCLRAAIVDARSHRLLLSRFVVAPRDAFGHQVGEMRLMDAAGRIAFASPELEFELTVKLFRALLPNAVQSALRSLQERMIGLREPPPAADAGDETHGLRPVPVELQAMDYPRTAHTGFVKAKVDGRDRPLHLRVDGGLGTVSHHFGDALAEFGFVTTVPTPDRASLIFVLARTGVTLALGSAEARPRLPFGYLIHTSAAGRSTLLPVVPQSEAHDVQRFVMGHKLLGANVEVKKVTEAGSVRLNDGALLTRTWFGEATLQRHPLLHSLGLAHGETFPDALIDLSGLFLEETEEPVG